jgi:hypothetical protein
MGFLDTSVKQSTLAEASASPCGTVTFNRRLLSTHMSQLHLTTAGAGPPACTVLNIAIGSAGRFASLLPGNRFPQSPDQCFKTRRRSLSRSGPDARNGLSLARNGCFFRSFHSEVNVPGLLLRFPACRFLYPFGLSALLPSPVSPGLGRFYASGPLQFPRLARRPRLQPPLPLRTFTSLRIKAFCWTCCLSARLPNPPDFPSLPAAGFYL